MYYLTYTSRACRLYIFQNHPVYWWHHSVSTLQDLNGSWIFSCNPKRYRKAAILVRTKQLNIQLGQRILFSSSCLSSKHNLEDSILLIPWPGQSIQQKANVKPLGVIFDQHITWINQINNIIWSTHGTLRALWKFRRFTPTKIRETLAEALIQALAWPAGKSPHPRCHLCKSRKRRLRWAMKSLPKGNDAWPDIAHIKF